jgi:RHS repeat-associated protein
LDVAALDAAATPLLAPDDRFASATRYDALNRAIQLVTPHRAQAPSNKPSVIQPVYNEANLLTAVDVWVRMAAAPNAWLNPATADLHAVTRIAYNARGQRSQIDLGNGASTEYAYDDDTFRLVNLTTTRPHANPDARVVQMLSYFYDGVGNITRLRDDADIHNVVFFRNQRVDPSADYTYDALYRLVHATGREHLGQNGGGLKAPVQVTEDDSSRMPPLSSNDGNAMGRYTEGYAYDAVGNILSMIHQANGGAWTRQYEYREASCIASNENGNRLTATSLPGDPEGGPFSATYAYDRHGNMARMPHLPRMTWDEDDRLQSTTRQVVDDGMPETTYYGYDSLGERVRKATYWSSAAGTVARPKSEGLYLGPIELYREFGADGSVALERETLHVMDDRQRIAIVETRTLGNDAALEKLTRYQFANHLGSAVLELDEAAGCISYEEYFPFGSTSYQARNNQVDLTKSYRHSAKPRDRETDFYYYGSRYYAPWVGRWISCDPSGLKEGVNLFVYANCTPPCARDRTGRAARQDAKANDVDLHGSQGKRGQKDPVSGKYEYESEHVSAIALDRENMRNPATGKSPIPEGRRHWADKDVTTVVWPRTPADVKTKSDMDLWRDVKREMKKGGLTKDTLERLRAGGLTRMDQAATETGTKMPEGAEAAAAGQIDKYHEKASSFARQAENNPMVGATDVEISEAVERPLSQNEQKIEGNALSVAATKDASAKTVFKGNFERAELSITTEELAKSVVESPRVSTSLAEKAKPGISFVIGMITAAIAAAIITSGTAEASERQRETAEIVAGAPPPGVDIALAAYTKFAIGPAAKAFSEAFVAWTAQMGLPQTW